MDNSISADADNIEILLDLDVEPFTLFLVDNGNGMSEEKLQAAMQFPSKSPDDDRNKNDLGRFGLGLKTASFSQTRKFSVITRDKDNEEYSGRTWDVDILRTEGWKLVINTQEEIKELVGRYTRLSSEYLNRVEDFEPSTIVIWHGLYKFEDYIENANRLTALKREITEVTSEYLSLVFHRFMERKNFPLRVRINNKLLTPFNPFPASEKGLRKVQFKQRIFGEDFIKMEGFVLPVGAIEESEKGNSIWVTKYMGLMEMEGVYIYRADRIILFGGWNGLIKKAPRLQLARLRVEIGNAADHLLHLNVAKSQVIIPHDLKEAFSKYIQNLKEEAVREYYNRGNKKISATPSKSEIQLNLFNKNASNKGVVLNFNKEFPLYKSVSQSLEFRENGHFLALMKMVETAVNNIRNTHSPEQYRGAEETSISTKELSVSIDEFLRNGLDKKTIIKDILPLLGFDVDSLPQEVLKELEG
jgi:hypothetical protein